MDSDKKLYRTIDNHLNNLLKESAEVTINPPAENPYYPRSYSTNGNEKRSDLFTMNSSLARRRNSDISTFSRIILSMENDDADNADEKTRSYSTNGSHSNKLQLSESKSNDSRLSTDKEHVKGSTNDEKDKGKEIDSEKDKTLAKGEEIEKDKDVFKEPALPPIKKGRRKSLKRSDKDKDILMQMRRSYSSNTNGTNSSFDEQQFTPPNKNTLYELVNQSPFGPLNNIGSRRTFAYLIAVLNCTYPDHDFSSLEPSDFKKITPIELIQKFNNILISLGKLPMEWIWDTLRNHLDLYECNVFYYKPSDSFLEDEPGSLWSKMWFICNKKKKLVCYLYLNAIKREVPFRSDAIYLIMGADHKRRKSITIDDGYGDDDDDDDSFDEYDYDDEEALMSDIDEE